MKTSAIGTNTKCPICGTPFNCFTAGKPKTYCSDLCREFNKYYNAVEDRLLKINFYDNKARKSLKSDLWALSNKIVIKKDKK